MIGVEKMDCKLGYDIIMKELRDVKIMYDAEEEKVLESLYWDSYVRRSILAMKEEMEDPDAKNWSAYTILDLLSQA